MGVERRLPGPAPRPICCDRPMSQDYPGAEPPAPRPRKWTDEDQARAERLRQDGLSYRAIAKELGWSDHCTRMHLCPEKNEAANVYRKVYYQQNKEKHREQEHAWRQRNLEADRANRKAWRQRNREKCRGYTNAYYARNLQTEREKAREFYRQNREAEKARKKACRDRDPEKWKAYWRNWSERNRERCRASTRAWQERNPEKAKEWTRQRAAAKRASRRIALAPLTLAEKIVIFASFGDCCAYCGIDGKLTVDHVLPLSKGGLDEAGNVVPACLDCNCRKRTAPVEQWYRRQPFFTEDRWLKIQQQCPASTAGQASLALPL